MAPSVPLPSLPAPEGEAPAAAPVRAFLIAGRLVTPVRPPAPAAGAA